MERVIWSHYLPFRQNWRSSRMTMWSWRTWWVMSIFAKLLSRWRKTSTMRTSCIWSIVWTSSWTPSSKIKPGMSPRSTRSKWRCRRTTMRNFMSIWRSRRSWSSRVLPKIKNLMKRKIVWSKSLMSCGRRLCSSTWCFGFRKSTGCF